jgi:cytochrome c553
MTTGRRIGALFCALIIVLMGWLAITKEGGYKSASEVEATLTPPKAAPKPAMSEEERKLSELRKASAGSGSFHPTSKLFASKCSACHGKNGGGRFNDDGEVIFPRIAGLEEAHIIKRLEEFKSGRVKNPLMVGVLHSLSDDNILALAHEVSQMGQQ